MSSVIDQTMPVKEKKKTPAQLSTRVIPLDGLYFARLFQPKLVVCGVVPGGTIYTGQVLTLYPDLKLFHRLGGEFITKVEFKELIQHHVIVGHAKIQHGVFVHYDLRCFHPGKFSGADVVSDFDGTTIDTKHSEISFLWVEDNIVKLTRIC